MTDSELHHTRPTEAMNLTVLTLRNLRGQRGDNLVAMVRVEWNDKNLGESTKVDCNAETPTELNHSSSLPVNFDDYKDLDDVAHKPVLLSVVEVLPKEKRQKEEKTLLLGQCTIDLFPMLQADTTKHRQTLTIHPIAGSPIENLPSEIPKPELDILLSVADPLVPGTMASDTNLMNVTIESLYSPPDAFQLSGAQFVYVASLPLPVGQERETTLVFSNGQLKPGVEKEHPNKQKRWISAGVGAQPSNALYIPNSMLSEVPMDKEDGDYKSKEDREHRMEAEHDKNRVTWNNDRRCFLEGSACKALQDKIAKSRLWPVEVMRMPIPAAGKGKKLVIKPDQRVDDENQVFYHGVAFVNLAPLLYPGVTKIKGAYKIYPYIDHDYMEKTRRKHNTVDEAVKTVHGQLNRGVASPSQKGKGGKEDKKADPKKASAQMKSGAPAADGATDIEPPQNTEGAQYVEHKSYLSIEIQLARPMVPKRPPQELARRVAEYIPPRPAFPKRSNGAQKAVEDFQIQVANVAQLILEELRDNEIFEDLRRSIQEDDRPKEEHRQALLYELNSTGKYFAFKEQLKHSVIKIVREKYLQTTNFASQEQLQAFLSELYVYLVDQMHVALNKFLSLEDKTPAPTPLTDSAQLKHFAREAEVNGDFELADKYYKERIARDRLDPEHWFDYGTYNLYINDVEKAEECFKECISINQSHLEGLLMYGIVCAMQERNTAAETFFEAATNVAPQSVVAWTIRSLFYDGIENDIGAEMASIEANKMNIEQARRQQRAAVEAALSAAPVLDEPEEKPAEQAAPPAEADGGPSSAVHQSASSSKMGGSASRSGSKADGKKTSSTTKKAGSATGSQLGSRTKSQESLNSVRPPSQVKSPAEGTAGEELPSSAAVGEPIREPTPMPQTSIYMQTAEWLLDTRAIPFTERALGIQLLISAKNGDGPSSDYYIAMARLRLQKKELDEAEQELNEALQLDFQNPDAWSIMGHLKFLSGDTAEAKDCYERTLSFLSDPSETHSIYLRLASTYLQDGEFAKAKLTFLSACRKSPSCVSWLGVGIACYRLDELIDAEDALSEANILNNEDAEVWGYLSLVCLRTGRQLEAEQAYKYALKLNLKDQDLLNEIKQMQVKVGFGNPEL